MKTKPTTAEFERKLRKVAQKEFTFETLPWTPKHGFGGEVPAGPETLNVAVSSRAFCCTVLIISTEVAYVLNLGMGHGLSIALHAQPPDGWIEKLYYRKFIRKQDAEQKEMEAVALVIASRHHLNVRDVLTMLRWAGVVT